MKDMFECYEELPIEVQAVLDKFSECENDYENCGNLVDELETIGWTFDFHKNKLLRKPCSFSIGRSNNFSILKCYYKLLY